MGKPLRLEPEARREIREATSWYEQQRRGLGIEFLEAVDEALGRASNLGPDCRPAAKVAPELGVRRVLCKRFPYVIFLVETASSVRILAIGHERREPGYWSGRMRR